MGIILQTGGREKLEIHKLELDKDFKNSVYSIWSNDKEQRLELTLDEAKQIIRVLQKDLFDSITKLGDNHESNS